MNITIISCFDTYEHRVELLKRTLEADGYPVSVVMSNFRHIKKCVRTDAPEGYTLVPAHPYYRNLSVDRLWSHDRFAKDALTCAERQKPDILWVLAPPNSLVKQAARFKQRHPEAKLVLDMIDMWPETMPISRFKNTLPFHLWQNLRDDFVNQADMVVTECQLFQQSLRNACDPKKLHTLYLARDFQFDHRDAQPPTDHISLCYLGSINNIIDIPCIGTILRQMDEPVELHIIGDGERREFLCQTAQEAGAKVTYHGIIEDLQEKQDIFRQCHAGLNIMKESVYVGLTMKSMDYFAASLPILNNIHGDTWDFVERYPIGINFAPDKPITGADIRQLQTQRKQVRAFYDNYFTEEVFLKRVRELLENLLGHPAIS